MISASHDHVAAAVERNLDDLQLRLTQSWPATIRGIACGIGIAGAIVAGIIAGVGGFWPIALLLLIGAGAGLFASVIYDLFELLPRLRDREA